MNYLRNFSLALLLLAANVAFAQTVIKDIRVEGLKNIEPGTVYGYLPLRVGDIFNDDKATGALRALFNSGLFKDAKLRLDKDTLVVTVVERPVIASITFEGLKEFSKDPLLKAFRDIGISEGRPYNSAAVNTAVQELKGQYFNRGFYSIQISADTKDNDVGNTHLTFTVVEGGQTKIKDVRIFGSKAFSASTLLDQIDLSGPTWLTWYTKANQYEPTKLNADVEKLRSFYLQRGYLQFQITSTEVLLSPQRDSLEVRLYVDEGKRFTVTDYQLTGDYLGRQSEFQDLVALKRGDIYNVEKVNQTTQAFNNKFASYGYTFSKVSAIPVIDAEAAKVSFTIEAQPRSRVYVRYVKITGNTRTRDEVIRREVRQLESSWYEGDKIKLSRDRIDRLGFFKDVEINTVDVPGTNDQVDLIVKVGEKPTAAVSVGASYSSSEKLGFIASVNQENAFGTGNSLGLEINTSSLQRTLALSQTTPYVNDQGLSRTLDLHYRTTYPSGVQGSDFKVTSPGAKVIYGIPVSEIDSIYAGLGVDIYRIELGSSPPTAYKNFVTQFGEKTTSFPITLGWQRDQRDSALVPTQGTYRRLFAEYSPGNELKFVRGSAQFQIYYPVTRRFTLAFNTELDAGKGLGGTSLPLFKTYYGGGLGSVRGYVNNSLGPVDSAGNVIGGNKLFYFNTELLSPFPGAGADRTLRWFLFADGGNVWGADQKLGAGGLRYSAGFGISWVSPIGPLKFNYGYPLNEKAGDRTERFQFQVGTAF